MTDAERESLNRQRRADISLALQQGWSLADLSKRWSLSRPGVTQWCRNHIAPEIQRELAENGKVRADSGRRSFHLPTRLELIALCRREGWPLDKIGMALGCANTAICHFLQRHAPDGIDQALEDFQEDEAA